MSPHLATVERFQQRKPQRSRKWSPKSSMPKDILKRVKLCIEGTDSCETSVYNYKYLRLVCA